VASHFAGVTAATRFNLAATHLSHKVLGDKLQGGLTGGIRKLSGDRIPLWNRYMPTAGAMPKPETSAIRRTDRAWSISPVAPAAPWDRPRAIPNRTPYR
jgi:hypothetical protein